MDLSVLSLSLKKFVACKHCGAEDCVVLLEDQSNRKGLACRLVLVCNSCKQEFSFYSSKKTDHGYESNIRMVYGLRCIWKGNVGGIILCGILNLPKPPSKFHVIADHIHNYPAAVDDSCMKDASKDAIEENNGNSDISTAVDGS